MIVAAVVLIAGELAVFTERGEVEIVAITIKAILGEIFVIFEVIFFTEVFSFRPGLGFDFEEFDVRMVICFADEVVAEFMQEKELGFGVGIIGVGGIKKPVRRGELEAVASLDF